MNIAFDIFLKRPELISVANSLPHIDEALNSLLSFVIERLMPLDNEIKNEEGLLPEGHAGTLILLDQSPQTQGKFIVFVGYSEVLTSKMLSCFSAEDMDYIMRKIKVIPCEWGN